MNYEVVSEPKVALDLIEIFNYYSEINYKLANDFLAEFEKVELIISNIPKGFEVKYKKVRTLKIERFPYLVHYFLEENYSQAIIIAITHSHKNPSDYTLR